jgi:nucleoside-diphosphate-sugar epimerase
MKVLVTGASGFIGSHLVAHLVARGDAVRALVSPAGEAIRLGSWGVEVARGDVRDAHAVERAVAGCDIVYHLAAHRSRGRAPEELLRAVNVGGTENLARAAIRSGVGRLVLCSAARVYGVVCNPAITEDTELQPDSPYARSRVLAERVVTSLHEHNGLAGVVARMGPVLGPGAKTWLPVFRGLAMNRFRLSGRGDNYQHPADVSDIVDGLVRCGTIPGVEGRVYLLAGGEPIRLRHLLQLIASEVGGTRLRSGPPKSVLRLYLHANAVACRLTGAQLPGAERPFLFLADRIFDLSRARSELQYAPRVSIAESVRRTADWYRAQGLL